MGFTSHDCVGKVRRLLAMKRVGHGGTLDPLATGVLPIALGSATRLLPYLPTDKAYRATIRLGMTTTTDDLGGEILNATPSVNLNLTDLEEALDSFLGQIQQRPPAYSAIQIQGQRCYDLARQGKPVPIEPRTVEIFAIEIVDWRPRVGEFAEVDVAIACGPGTYIRSLARDLGEQLHIGGTLANLRRTRSCGMDLEESLTLEILEAAVAQHQWMPLALDTTLPQPKVILTAEWAQRFRWGQTLPSPAGDKENRIAEAQIVQVHDMAQGFLGMGYLQDNELHPKVVMPS